MQTPQQTIGILGGMGPNASADFLRRILRLSNKRYGAVQDDEFPKIILNSIGLRGFSIEGVTDLASVTRQLIEGIRLLDQAGAQLIAIPCNTVHCCYDAMVAETKVPILHIADVTARAVSAAGIRRVGLCSSVTTVRMKLYEQACAALGIDVIVPSSENQENVNDVIESVMAGRNDEEEMLALKSVILSLQMRGAEGVILGCTELPLAINQKWTDVPLFDSLELLAKETVERVYDKSVRNARQVTA